MLFNLVIGTLLCLRQKPVTQLEEEVRGKEIKSIISLHRGASIQLV